MTGDWQLWLDWCTATDRNPATLTVADLVTFTTDLSATAAVADRRVRSIHRALTGAGRGLPRPSTPLPPRLVRNSDLVGGDGGDTGYDGSSTLRWLTTGEALTAMRHEGYPEGVAARRDALILVLAAAGFTRRRIWTLRSTQIVTSTLLTVDTVPLERHTDHTQCPRCVVVRWLKVLAAYRHRSRYDVEDLITDGRTVPRPRHDCITLLEDGWQHAGWVIPAIDRWGALQPTVPLSARAMTAVLTRRHRPAVVRSHQAAVADPSSWDPHPGLPSNMPPGSPRAGDPTGRRPSLEEQRRIGDLWGRAEHDMDELSDRIIRLLQDHDSLMGPHA